MKRIISFGDSFTAGLGTDRKYEESHLGEHPMWKTWSDKEKNLARKKVHQFRNKNSFTKFFADYFDCEYINNGNIGCNNMDIVNYFFTFDKEFGFEKNDLVLIGFTSSMRDKLPWMPDIFNNNVRSGITWSTKELSLVATRSCNIVWADNEFRDKYDDFFHSYLKHYVVELYDEKYFNIFNLNLVSTLQHYLNYLGVDYIMFDAFEPMFTTIPNQIDTHTYWECGTNSIWSYLNQFDRDLFELDGYSINKEVHKHPNTEGHKVFAKELFRYYNETR